MKRKSKRSKGGRKQGSAGSLLNAGNTFERNLGVAIFGKTVRTERHANILALVGEFEQLASLVQHRARTNAVAIAQRRFDKIARPMLLEALERQDAQSFLDFAQAIKAAQRIRSEGPIQSFHARLLRFAASIEPQFAPGQTIPFTAQQLKAEMKLPQSVEYFRRECKVVGVGLLPDKVGRPRKLRTIPARRKS